MPMLATLSNISRSEGDPKVISSGPSSLTTADRFGRALGWFSIGLGLAEIVGARRITHALGMEGSETMIRACGVREIGEGIMCLSTEKQTGLWSRVAGDAVDIAMLASAMKRDNPKRENAGLALAAIVGITLLDLAAAGSVTATHGGGDGQRRSYRDRSGFPKGLQAARGAAKEMATAPVGSRGTSHGAGQQLSEASGTSASNRPRPQGVGAVGAS